MEHRQRLFDDPRAGLSAVIRPTFVIGTATGPDGSVDGRTFDVLDVSGVLRGRKGRSQMTREGTEIGKTSALRLFDGGDRRDVRVRLETRRVGDGDFDIGSRQNGRSGGNGDDGGIRGGIGSDTRRDRNCQGTRGDNGRSGG